MKKTKITKKKGFTLFEMLAAIAVLALLGVMITVGSNLATHTLNKSMYITNSSLLSDTLNKAMTDVLRYSVPTEATENNIKFTCDIYGVKNGYFTVNSNGLIYLNFGESTVHVDNKEELKPEEPILNIGTYTDLKITNLVVDYNTEKKIYEVSYSIKSDKLNLERDWSFIAKPFDIKYQDGSGASGEGGGSGEGGEGDNPGLLCIHSWPEKWTAYEVDNGYCYAYCLKCGQKAEKKHSVKLSEINNAIDKITVCGAYVDFGLPCERCGTTVTKTLRNDNIHDYEYSIPEDEDAAKLQHIGTCKICGYVNIEVHYIDYSKTADKHSGVCKCGYSVNDSHTFTYVYDDSMHQQKCTVCDYRTEGTAHSFSYVSNTPDDGTHSATCSVCSYARAKEEHVFKQSDLDRIEEIRLTLTQCGMTGNYTYSCIYCNATINEVIKSDLSDNSHYYQYDILSTEQHKVYCLIEGCTFQETHNTEVDRTWITDQHQLTCKQCSLKIEGKHVYEYTITEERHQRSNCKLCGYEHNINWNGKHDPVYTISTNEDGTYDTVNHKKVCETCGYDYNGSTQNHKFEDDSIDRDNKTHTVKCKDCGLTQTHTIRFVSNGYYNHSIHCDTCNKNLTLGLGTGLVDYEGHEKIVDKVRLGLDYWHCQYCDYKYDG